MKTYKVYYKTPATTNSIYLLVNEGSTIEEALANKDSNFKINDKWSQIVQYYEVPISNVKVGDLSVTEFISLVREGKLL